MSPQPEGALCVWWNVERLFEPSGSSIARDLDVTAATGWTRAAYRRKVERVAAVLKALAGTETPVLVGLCEVQSRRVAEDLLEELGWRDLAYAEDPGERLEGADVVLLYSTAHFTLGCARAHDVHNQYASRDILEVELRTRAGDDLLVLLNHWPSRRYPESEPLRITLADFCARIAFDHVQYRKSELFDAAGRARFPGVAAARERWHRPVLVLGDLNDSPYDTSVARVLHATRSKADVAAPPRFPQGRGLRSVASYLRLQPRLYNPGWRILTHPTMPQGTCVWHGAWYLLDQVILSAGLLGGDGLRYVDDSLAVFTRPRVLTARGDEVRMTTSGGRPEPFDPRTGAGVSDHLPLTFRLVLG